MRKHSRLCRKQIWRAEIMLHLSEITRGRKKQSPLTAEERKICSSVNIEAESHAKACFFIE